MRKWIPEIFIAIVIGILLFYGVFKLITTCCVRLPC
jgi:hypothetical protein